MIHFIRHKIQNKKWLNSCLLVGVALLSAFLCIYPMFKEGSLNRLLQTLFTEYLEEHEEYPAIIKRSDKFKTDEYDFADDVISKMNEYEKSWVKYIDLPVVQRQQVLSVFGGNAETTFGDKTKQITLGYVPNLYEHADVVYGIKAEESEKSSNELVNRALKEGAYPCMISQTLMDKYELVVGEVLSFKFKMYSNEQDISFVVTGIIEEKDDGNSFWHNRLNSYEKMVFLSVEEFNSILKKYDVGDLFYDEIVMFDYTKVNSKNAGNYSYYLKELNRIDNKLEDNFTDTLSIFGEKEKTINVILFTFELPIISLLLLFIYMISSQILEMETTEISMLKSRGISRRKVVLLYILQSSIISAFGILIGMPLGYVLCKCGAGTNGFLSFTLKDVSIYKATWEMIPFSLIAFVLSVLFMTIPVIKLSTLTITERKSRKVGVKEKAFWEKYFLDVVLLIISSYLIYNYYKQSNYISTQVISGKSVDPIIFLDSSLFILSCGLVFLRLIHYLVRLIYRIGKDKWKPASYVSFLQITRSVKKQEFISVFLVMTIAIGVFNTNLARTINENMEQRTQYNVGTDLIVNEKWQLQTLCDQVSVEILWNYLEPDFKRYDVLNDLGVVQKTKVIKDNNVDISINGKIEKGNTLMAINTKEFGETAKLKNGLNDKHWYHYLNALAKQQNGVLISTNLAKKYSLSIGDNVSYARYSPLDTKTTYASSNAIVCGIVDAFPGYESTVYTTLEDGKIEERDNYLIVANYATVINNFNLTPYSVWMRLSENADELKIMETLKENNIVISNIQSSKQLIQSERDSAMLQITNGLFSVGFIISLLICGVGFLIYWILTIRERELLYGIYRAMGMSMKEIANMLIIEQIFSSLLAVFAGFGVGSITTFLFTRLISIVYLPQKHNIAIDVFVKAQDSIKMFIIVSFVFVVCFIIIRKIVRNMNITKGLKMGAD